MSRLTARFTSTSCLAIAVLIVLACGCSSYPQVTSAESLKFIRQVYTACNTKSPERVAKCAARLNELTAEKLISESEEATFRQILELAESGDWEASQQQALEFAQRQVE